MIEELFSLEQYANQQSFFHLLDARVKFIVVCATVVAMVSVPYSSVVYPVAGLFMLYLALLWIITRLPYRIYFSRLVTALPFGFMICGFQIFFTNKYYTEYHVFYALPLGVNIYTESVHFASILLLKFLVCFSFIILLSCTTTLQDLLDGAARLKMPPDFVLALGMMIRYLFVFGQMYQKIHETFQSKCFDPFDRSLSYRYRITQMGYTLGTMFIRSFEQGERTYMSMLCRGYGRGTYLYICKKALSRMDIRFLTISLGYIIIIPLVCWIRYQ
ncbi:MAG TPA: cobalt ECF transporter T component CbiQ [Methanospirillum sp.]|uniref:cobalt ECF transporter T component CbiQ n=1 Tax=Methanospirillum sp. TaxID=45200 RepID=UPI002CFE984E|nr:cobalt ECF transporter T component CbiQ [Methanospirillum sp.]HWQ62774.1 cobalt ECF transporter T component CbiQ [Methanospirillum sp.]